MRKLIQSKTLPNISLLLDIILAILELEHKDPLKFLENLLIRSTFTHTRLSLSIFLSALHRDNKEYHKYKLKKYLIIIVLNLLGNLEYNF